MVSLYADENWPGPLTAALRELNLDVLTAYEDGRAGQGIDDADLLARSTELGRCLLTMNRDDFQRLHATGIHHAGIITARDFPNRTHLAQLILQAVAGLSTENQLIRIIRPPS